MSIEDFFKNVCGSGGDLRQSNFCDLKLNPVCHKQLYERKSNAQLTKNWEAREVASVANDSR